MPPGRRAPGPVPKGALAFFAAKGLKPGFSYKDVWAEEHKVAFTVAKVMELDLLGDIHDSLITAMEDGIPFAEWRKEMKPTFDKSGWSEYNRKATLHRMRVIYQTNMRTSRARGQWERIQRTKQTTPFLLYSLGSSQRHRPLHAEVAGTILPVDDSFWDEMYPPNGHGCKCYITALSRRRTERAGGVTRAPERVMVPWKDSNGNIQQIRRGVQPGFDHHVGKKAPRERSLKQQEKEGKQKLRETQVRINELLKEQP